MIRVNIGCGKVHHPDWINLDFVPASKSVRACDLREGLPFESETVDCVYHSHVLEHLDKETGRRFLKECRRILRPAGIVRVLVPDLEAIIRTYLTVLDDPRGPDTLMLEWLRLELIDQCVRVTPGGEMSLFVKSLTLPDLERVRRRIGLEVDSMAEEGVVRRSMVERIRTAGFRRLVDLARVHGSRLLVRVVGGRRLAVAFDEGVFRSSGEVHRAVYDRFSLRTALVACGFERVRLMEAGLSEIPQFPEHALEIENGVVRKPDSLIMEAVRR